MVAANCIARIFRVCTKQLESQLHPWRALPTNAFGYEELREGNRAAGCNLQSMEERPPTHDGPAWLASRHIWLRQNHPQSHQRYPEYKRDPFRGSGTTRTVWHRWQSAPVLLVCKEIHPRCRDLASRAGSWLWEPSFAILISNFHTIKQNNKGVWYWSKKRGDVTHVLSELYSQEDPEGQKIDASDATVTN